MNQPSSRRDFLKHGAVLAAGASLFNVAHAAPKGGSLKVALIGCGGRGAGSGGGGALRNFIDAAKLLGREVDIVAVADCFEHKARRVAESHKLPESRVLSGFSSYKRVMESDAEYVLLATPPVFRPLHLAAAVAAGKHVFFEKPVAVDPVGVRKVIEIGEAARAKGLCLVAGTQRRHDIAYLTNKAQIEAGAIGTILGGTVSWDGKVPWIVHRKPGLLNREYLVENWLNFTELSGDHICEQHVHNVDVANWFIGRVPVAALGYGGRLRRETGNQYDFFSVDFDYGDGVHIHSQCRQISGCYNRVGEFFRGTEGQVFGGGKLSGREVKVPAVEVLSENALVQEHVDLIKGVLDGKPENRAREVAEATMTAILGRISAYTGKMVRWRELMDEPASPFYNLSLAPRPEDFEGGDDVGMPADHAALPGDGAPFNVRKT
ncbi:MAG: Gfo/Idh/MocA family oxidoreductase [Opitutaceae bacterium]|nr:Gfo/Idh/MocA family oxidoreductase [Opitutaceae bacterium]